MKNKTRKDSLNEWIISLLIGVIIAIIIKTFVFDIVLVRGASMNPTLKDGDKLINNKIIKTLNNYERGDIVVLKAPDNKNKFYIKRIIGIEGDTIEIKKGKVFLNSKILKEKYASANFTHSYEKNKWSVSTGKVFVLGDNREEGASNDSRFFGCVDIDKLLGETSIRYYPFNSIEKFD